MLKSLPTIVLFDYHLGGHHLTYLRLFSRTLLEMGCQVMTFSQKPDEVSNWININCPETAPKFYAFKIEEPASPVLPILGRLPEAIVVLTRWRYAAMEIQKASLEIGHSPDLVFFCWLDSYFSRYLSHHIIERIFPYTWSGLYFQLGDSRFKDHLLPIFGVSLKHYALAQSSLCRGIAVLNEIEADKLQKKIKNLVITFPDITDNLMPDPNYEVAKTIPLKAGNRKIVGLIGSLSKRKGILTLLEVAKKTVEKDLFFVFVGHLSNYGLSPQEEQEIQNFIKSKPSNCFFHLEWIPDEAKFNAIIDSCDILFAAYENFPHSSNILNKVAIFKKPVIVSDGFCMGERVKKFKLGLTIPEQNVSKCIEALDLLYNDIKNNNINVKFKFDKYKYAHSIDRISDSFQQII